MNKIKKAINAVKEIIKNPWLLNSVIDDNSVWERKIIEKYKMINGFPVVALDELFPNFSETLHSFSFSGGGSLPTDIALLKSLCRKKTETSYFEIGTWRGESVKNVSEIAKECYTLNLSKEEIVQLTGSKEYADAHFFFSKNISNVKQLFGNSKTFDFKGLNKKFDVIFIDGDHHYESIKKDTENVFQHLMKEDSIIVWHDYAFSPEKLRFETMHAILDGVPENLHQHLYFVANSMSAIFIKGEFKTSEFQLHSDPVRTFEIQLKTKKIEQ